MSTPQSTDPAFDISISIDPVTKVVSATISRTDNGEFSCTPDPANKNGSQGNNVPPEQWPDDYDQTTEYLQSVVVNSANTGRTSINIPTDFKDDAAGKILVISVFDENGLAKRKKKRTTQNTQDAM